MADATCFLLSPLARGITGEIVHVDGGYPRHGSPAPMSVLLTGATGFLGMEVLVRLLEQPDTEIVALVRARDREAAAARIETVLGQLYENPAAPGARRRGSSPCPATSASPTSG